MSGDGAAGATSKLNAGSAGVMERGAGMTINNIHHHQTDTSGVPFFFYF